LYTCTLLVTLLYRVVHVGTLVRRCCIWYTASVVVPARAVYGDNTAESY